MIRLLAMLTYRILTALSIAVNFATVKAPPPKGEPHPRGHKTPSPEVLAARHAAARGRHDDRMKHLAKATPAQYDLRALNRTGPIQDQGNCGSCWDVSACGVVTDALIASGQFSSADASKTLSSQYILDQCNGITNGGCDGDDAPTVLVAAKNIGLPTTADYGPYTAAPGRCQFKQGTKLWRIADWGYCTPSQQQGVAGTQDIKNALVQYGTISSAVAADGGWDSVGADGVIRYSTSNAIDHDVAIIGWDDERKIPGAPKAGAWFVKNQWGTGWGASGYCWLAYGSHGIGTEAAWAAAGQLPPPPPPPTPPGPTPAPAVDVRKVVDQMFADLERQARRPVVRAALTLSQALADGWLASHGY